MLQSGCGCVLDRRRRDAKLFCGCCAGPGFSAAAWRARSTISNYPSAIAPSGTPGILYGGDAALRH
eukprot:11162599-Lingulodinium_polyedra.AAC.1